MAKWHAVFQPRHGYNPMSYKWDKREEKTPMQHVNERRATNSKGEPQIVTDYVIKCSCIACREHLALIKLLNPARYQEMLPDEDSKPFLRRRTEREKQFSNDRFRRENLGKTLSRHLT